jgi:two-component system chemotaxis response regulator CheB
MDCRVLIVDDSPTVRAVLRRILGAAPGIQVAGEAGDGREAVERTLSLRPDAIVMDLEMPGADGYFAIEQIMARRPTPIVVVTSRVQRDQMGAAFQALARGAVSVFPKPGVPNQWRDLAQVLPETLREVGSRSRSQKPVAGPLAGAPSGHRFRFLAVGASTGGPGAICQLLRELGQGFRLRVAVVQHIAAGFEVGFADWLAQELGLDVRVARDAEEIPVGAVRIAPADFHLHVDPLGALRLDGVTPPVRGHRPSVDQLFLSLARSAAREVAAVLLTGMGNDGAEGLLELRRAGGFTVVQDEASCAVFGMPRAALESGAADLALPPREIGRLLARTVAEAR